MRGGYNIPLCSLDGFVWILLFWFGFCYILKLLIATVIEDQVSSLPLLRLNAAVMTDAG